MKLDFSIVLGRKDSHYPLFHTFGNLATMTLGVSAHGRIHSLCLRDCSEFRDVSALNNIHKLDVSYCIKSRLNSVKFLAITDCYRIRGVSMITTLQEFKMQGCRIIHNLTRSGWTCNRSTAQLFHVRKLSLLQDVGFISVSENTQCYKTLLRFI
jgi:hypothetical protein